MFASDAAPFAQACPCAGHAKQSRRIAAAFEHIHDNLKGPNDTVKVVDEHSTLLYVPVGAVHTTCALGRSAVSICRLYMQGRCRLKFMCNFVHADIPTVLRLRQEALSQPSCCKEHGQPCDVTGYPPNTPIAFGGVTVPLNRTAPTVGLLELLAECKPGETVRVPPSLVCRLHHSERMCRFGSSCRFVHMCKSIVAKSSPAAVDSEEFESQAESDEEKECTTVPTILRPLTPGSPPCLMAHLPLPQGSPVRIVTGRMWWRHNPYSTIPYSIAAYN